MSKVEKARTNEKINHSVCVDVDDVLAQEEYRERFPNGESGAPFVFICTNPQELMIKFPMAGKHKICKFSFQQKSKFS